MKWNSIAQNPPMLIKFVNRNIISGVHSSNTVAAASGIALARAWMLRMFLLPNIFQRNRSLPLLAFWRLISINGTGQSGCDKAPCSTMLFPRWGQFFFSRYLRGENLQQLCDCCEAKTWKKKIHPRSISSGSKLLVEKSRKKKSGAYMSPLGHVCQQRYVIFRLGTLFQLQIPTK